MMTVYRGSTLLALVFLCLQCVPYKKQATGPQNRIVAVVSPEDRRLVARTLDSLFNRVMHTPEPEPYFELLTVNPSEFEEVKAAYNLVLVSLFSPPDMTGDRLVKNLLPSNQMAMALEGENQVFTSTNLFARDQTIMIAAARDVREFREAIQERSQWIFDKFDKAFLDRQEAYVYRTLEQKKLSRRLQNDYGWHIRMQHDYVILSEDSTRNLVKLGRSYPYRWITVHWTDRPNATDLSAADVRQQVEEFPRLYLDNMSFPNNYRRVDSIQFGRRSAYRVEGLWERTNEQKGGPFVSYVFYDPVTDRRFHINLLVYFPGGDKMILMRQMEIIARTFSVEPG